MLLRMQVPPKMASLLPRYTTVRMSVLSVAVSIIDTRMVFKMLGSRHFADALTLSLISKRKFLTMASISESCYTLGLYIPIKNLLPET